MMKRSIRYTIWQIRDQFGFFLNLLFSIALSPLVWPAMAMMIYYGRAEGLLEKNIGGYLSVPLISVMLLLYTESSFVLRLPEVYRDLWNDIKRKTRRHKK